MSKQKVSVIIPAYNSAPLLGRCLDSVFAQDLRPVQVIVINDGSTDTTADVAKRYADRIAYVEQENRGQAAARNVGLSLATGEFVAFLDSDDYWLPPFLKACAAFLEGHPEVIAVSTSTIVKLRGRRGKVMPSIASTLSEGRSGGPCVLEDFFGFWAKHNHIRTGSCVIRREVIDKGGYMLDDLWAGEDLEYWGYLATLGRLGFLPQVLHVMDGTAATAAQGWITRNSARWRRTPSVEQWQRRILPRLEPKDWPGFRHVRGRLASGFAHYKILAGSDEEARAIVLQYGSDFSRSRVGGILRVGARLGPACWRAACCALRLRERIRAAWIALKWR